VGGGGGEDRPDAKASLELLTVTNLQGNREDTRKDREE